MGTCQHLSTHREVPLPSPDLAAHTQNSAKPPTGHSSASPDLPGNLPTSKLTRAFNTNTRGVNAQNDSRKKMGSFFN